MKVEIWSDPMCPYCYLGKKRFELALADLDFADEIDIVWRAFELNPNAKDKYSESKFELLAQKYDQSEEWAKLLGESLAQQSQEIGINIDLTRNQVANTHTAHRLLKLAKQQGVETELLELLFKACFSDGQCLSDSQVLLSLASQVGMKADEVQQMLDSNNYEDEVSEDQAIASEIGIQSVPFFIIDEAIGMEGAQPIDHIKQMLTNVKQGAIA